MKTEAWTQYALMRMMEKALQGWKTIIVSAVDKQLLLSQPSGSALPPGYLFVAPRTEIIPIISLRISQTIHARITTAIQNGKLKPTPPSHKGIPK